MILHYISSTKQNRTQHSHVQPLLFQARLSIQVRWSIEPSSSQYRQSSLLPRRPWACAQTHSHGSGCLPRQVQMPCLAWPTEAFDRYLLGWEKVYSNRPPHCAGSLETQQEPRTFFPRSSLCSIWMDSLAFLWLDVYGLAGGQHCPSPLWTGVLAGPADHWHLSHQGKYSGHPQKKQLIYFQCVFLFYLFLKSFRKMEGNVIFCSSYSQQQWQ